MNLGQGRLQIEVKDQGRGMPHSGKPSQSSGLGLRGMHERIRQLGGTLQIDFTSGGTTVKVDLPVSQSPSAAEAPTASVA